MTEEELKQAYHNNVVLEGIKMTYEEYKAIWIKQNDSNNTKN